MTRVREARPADRAAVANVLDGAALDVAHDRLRERLAAGDALVAVAGGPDAESGGEERVLGALVLDGEEIAAVAVRRRRRGQGIGTALVEAAADRRERLAAEFDAGVRPFYERLGFAIEPAADETDSAERSRYRGVLRDA